MITADASMSDSEFSDLSDHVFDSILGILEEDSLILKGGSAEFDVESNVWINLENVCLVATVVCPSCVVSFFCALSPTL
jgi:hypothetical protein